MTRLDIISCPQDLGYLGDTIKVFLMGPIQGASDWQHNIPKIPGVTWISPRREDYANFDYDTQTSWETLGLRISDAILMWIPEPSEKIEGRGYAQTTRIEFGENLARRKTMFFGIWPGYNGRKYFVNKLGEYYKEKKEIHETLESVISELREWVKNRVPGTFFTSDTHFGQERTLVLSKRPFSSVGDMDLTMIERWNKIVAPGSTVYHLGDFGHSEVLKYLNGNIKLILGNYERDNKSEIPEGIEILGDTYETEIGGIQLIMSHEPLKIKDKSGMKLFGHIHGRQKVKPWEGLDVGVDSNNFTPCSFQDIEFYWNAMEKGYYDEEVWS
jgi:calcineurin-like phosphoesterase family protein